MAQEYVAMEDQSRGLIAINTNVFETIAKICVEEQKDVELTDPSYFKNAITCKMNDGKLSLNINVKVSYTAQVNDVCGMLQNKIHDNVKRMTGCLVDSIVINVVEFIF